MEFAAIQCQIHFGDFNEEKHKPGLIENLNEYLPEQYSSAWGAEKKILKLYRKHSGLAPLEAKHLYTKTARDLPTYGVTFFVVKEKQKGKKKMVPRLLGINAESILRLDEVTKEILQVWPLTHMKSYHAGTGSFTLNFGDYSDKEYCVKTHDAFRIRDILEGYIDIIRKRLCGTSSCHVSDSGAVAQENVESGRGNVMTHVVQSSSKVVEHSFVGPTKILPFEQGSKGTSGTQVMTVQQVIVTNKGSTTQQVLSGEVPLRSDMSLELVKKLNRMNSNAVKIVTLLTGEPNEANIQQTRSIIAAMEEGMPFVLDGVKEAAEKQRTEEEKRKLLHQLEELKALVASVSQRVKNDNMNPEEIQDQARQIADLTTQMYFALDSTTKRRSDFLRRSRQSFIDDENTMKTIRRASFIAASATASHAVDNAMAILVEEYQGAPLSARDVERLEASAVDKLAKLNGAIAQFLNAHADTKNVDYDAAVSAMNTIQELLPELATDARNISHSKGGDAGKEIMDELKALTDAARKLCQLTGCDDHQKVQDAAQAYADVSGRLVYSLGSGNPRVNADKENQIMDLAKDVGDRTTMLLVKANELTGQCPEPGATQIDNAGVACADAARDLLACAQLTSPTIREPHCQSALSASCEALSASTQCLAVAWRPHVEDPSRKQLGEDLTTTTMELAKALDALRNAYADLGNMDVVEVQAEEPTLEQARRLRFVATFNTACGALRAVQDDLNKPISPASLSDQKQNELQDSISQKLAQTNAAVASLLQAKSDPQNPDYDSAELTINTITEVASDVGKDARMLLSSCGSERGRQAMLADFRAWFAAVDDVCASAAAEDNQNLDEATQKFAKASKKLSFAFSPLARRAREQLMMELFGSAHQQALQMVDDTNKLAATMGGPAADALRNLGRDVQNSAAQLQNTLLVTAPTLDSDRCRSALLSSSGALATAAERLGSEAESLQDHETGCRVLSAQLQAHRAHIVEHADSLQKALEAIKLTLEDDTAVAENVESPKQKLQRLKFVTSTSAVRERAREAELLLDKPVENIHLSELQAKKVEGKRAIDLATVNAAIAHLINAKNDRNNPNYDAAEEAMETVSELMPGIVNDTMALSTACKDEAARAAMIADMRAWCDAITAVCASAPHDNLTEFVNSAQHFADTSDKLNFVFNPRKVTLKQQQVLQLSQSACATAHKMAADSNDTAKSLPPLPAANVRMRSKALHDAANALHTTAQLTAPNISEVQSRAALLASSECVSETANDLVSHSSQHLDPECRRLGDQLLQQKQQLDEALNGIKYTCSTKGTDAVESPTTKAQRLKFVSTLSAIHGELNSVENLLDQPTLGITLTDPQARDVKEKLSHDVARLNVAVAQLLQAKADVQNSDYVLADKAIETISELVPAVAKETMALSTACKDEAARAAMVKDMRAWCGHIKAVCSAAEGDKPQELEEAVQKLSASSGKMKFIVSCRKNPMKEHEVVQSAHSAVSLALQMCADARLACESGSLEQAAALERAARALDTTTQLLAPSIHEESSRSAIISGADLLSATAAKLVAEAKNTNHPDMQILAAGLQASEEKLATAVKELKDVTGSQRVSPALLESQQLKLTASAKAAEAKVEIAKKLLDQPSSSEVKLKEKGRKDVQDKMLKAMAQVNAALASLLNARSDPHQQNYAVAEQSCVTISELLPEIINDAKDLSACCSEEHTRAAMLADTRAWCDAIQAVCASAASEDAKLLNDSTLKYCAASQKLHFINSARRDMNKEQQVIQLSNSACDKAKQIVDETRLVANSIAPPAAALLTRADALSAAAAALRTTAQLEAPTIHEDRCQAALLSSADRLSANAALLVSEAAQADHPAARRLSEEASRYRDVLDKALASLRTATLAQDTHKRPPPPPVRSSATRRSVIAGAGAGGASQANAQGQAPRVRVVSHSNGRRASQEWLNHMREDASKEATLPPGHLSSQDIAALNKKAEDERQKKEKFQNIVGEAEENIDKAEVELNKIYNAKPSKEPVDDGQTESLERQLESKLALAGTAAAKLVSSNHPDVIDYATATQATETLSELMPDIIKDAALLSATRDEAARKALLDHIKALSAATRRILTTARDDSSKVNEAAMEFGDKSAGLLYAVAAHVDPAQEKGVIDRARSVGDQCSSLAALGAELAARGGAHAQAVLDGAQGCADAARTLVYTAKLVAPTVHNQQCQNALITASHELSSQLKTFSASWKPLSSDPKCSKTVADMNEKVKNLEKMLESFRHDLVAGTLVKKREVEKIVIEDTALRQLASQIMELAQMRACCGHTADDKKKVCSEYAGSLRAAIRALDVASSRRMRRPHDLTRHQDLEQAVQNLQISLLQSRPTLGDQPQNNVVDLTDFVKATSNEAEKLITVANKTKVKEDKKEVESIKAACHAVNVNAFRLMNPDERRDGDESSLDGLLEVDQFGQDCENRVQNIKETIESMKQKEAKDVLFNSSVPLIESCFYLRFATKSALATAQSASLDETIDDLNEFEKRLNKILLPTDSAQPARKRVAGPGLFAARSRVICAAAALPRAAPLPPALAAYVTEIRACTDLTDAQQRNRAKEHISKVLKLLKELTATCSIRVASWQPVACAEVASLTDNLIKELENPRIGDAKDGEKSHVKVLKEVDINRLLMPADVKIDGEPKKIEEKFQQTASKLVMLSDTLSQSAVRPESLARTAPAAADAALQLAAAARSLPAQSLAHAKRTEEAAQEMCWATYNLLKTAELVTRDPARNDARGQLRSASRKLTDAINKLARSACTGDRLNVQCGELTRALQGQVVTSSPAPAPPFKHCLQALNNQRAMIDQLNSDEPMSREEFSKSLSYVTSAVCNSTDYAAQCSYLITLSEKYKELALEGLVDVPRLQKLTSSIQESCYQIMRTNHVELAIEEEAKVSKLNQELQQAVKEANTKIKDTTTKRELTECVFKVDLAAKSLNTAVHDSNAKMEKINGHTLTLVESVGSLDQAVERGTLLPNAGDISQETKAQADEVITHSRSLINKTAALVKAVKSADDEEDPMKWVTYNTQRKSVVEAFEALLNCLKRNGEQVGLVDKEPEEEVQQWSFVRLQEERARKWLHRRPSTAGIQASGEEAARAIVDVATQMAEDMKGSEREETMLLITESNELIADCSKKYDNDKASALMDRLRELRRAVERGAVTCVVEDFLHADAPLQDFEIFVDAERDEGKRKLLLEKKIAELMSQLGRVSRTARLVARAGLSTQDIAQCCQQTELLAPQLVKAAQARVTSPHDAAVVERYRALLAQYASELTRVREMCDQAVDPLQFVQTAGETMARMREESSQLNDPRLCAHTSNAITRLANRVIVVSMSSHVARADPELRAALAEAQDKLSATTPAPGTRESRLPDWRDTTAEILRTTGEVESALGGENIFKKLPDSDQPIYNAALSLHSAVRGWSARDNELVGVAKRMAVLMARLSEQMSTERKRELIITSKAIVTESREVAALAKKLAQECSDVRIKTNLLQVCERIPTISGQLKMLTTVKGSTLGNLGGEEDREAMNMLVTNAQNLMSSVQEVVKAAASASVKIASQRGPKWVRKNY